MLNNLKTFLSTSLKGHIKCYFPVKGQIFKYFQKIIKNQGKVLELLQAQIRLRKIGMLNKSW